MPPPQSRLRCVSNTAQDFSSYITAPSLPNGAMRMARRYIQQKAPSIPARVPYQKRHLTREARFERLKGMRTMPSQRSNFKHTPFPVRRCPALCSAHGRSHTVERCFDRAYRGLGHPVSANICKVKATRRWGTCRSGLPISRKHYY